MSESPIELRGKGGGVVFQGTQSPGGGGSQPLVRLPIAWNTPGLAIEPFGVTAVDQGTQTFTVAGNHAAGFAPGDLAVMGASYANGGLYTVVSATVATDHTDIVVAEAIAAPTVEGSLANVTTGGLVLHVPSEGELFLFAGYSVPVTSFEGTGGGGAPNLNIFPAGTNPDDGGTNLLGFNTSGHTNGETPIVPGIGTLPSLFTPFLNIIAVFLDANPVRVIGTDGNGEAPGFTQGEGEALIYVLP